MEELENINQLFNQFSNDADEFAKSIKENQERKPQHATLDNKPITSDQWEHYDNRIKEWRELYKDNLTSFEAAMNEPNPPNYFRANND